MTEHDSDPRRQKKQSRRDDLSIADVEAHFLSNYVETQYELVQFLTEHLSDCSEVFGGDLVEMLVLAIIGQATLERYAHEGVPKSVNASRISDTIGIPRQTVRRKLLRLAERGWIVQNASAGWGLVMSAGVANARRDLKGLDGRGIRRLAKLYVALNGMVARQSQ